MLSKKKEVRDAVDNLAEFKQILYQFRDFRLNTLQQLENLLAKAKEEEALKHHGRNTQIALLSGSSVGIVGGVIAVVGFGLSFVTFGTSLILTGVGAGVGGAGGITVVGTKVTSYFLNKKLMKEVKQAINKDREASKKLLGSYNKTLSSLKKVNQTGTLKDIKDLLEQVQNSPVKHGLLGAKNLAKDIIFDSITTAGMFKGAKTSAAIGRGVVAGADAAVDASGSVFKSLSTAGRAFQIIGVVGTGISLLMDFYTLYTESIKINKGTTDLEEKIEDFIEKLNIPDDFVDQCLKEVMQEASRNEGKK